jgi:hypothetical protein
MSGENSKRKNILIPIQKLFFRSRGSRAASAVSTASIGAASAAVPINSAGTSAGASKNASEISRHLDEVLRELDGDGEALICSCVLE